MSTHVSKLSELQFGSTTFLGKDGTTSFYCLKILDEEENEFSFIFGDNKNYSDEKVDQMYDKLNEFMDLIQS